MVTNRSKPAAKAGCLVGRHVATSVATLLLLVLPVFVAGDGANEQPSLTVTVVTPAKNPTLVCADEDTKFQFKVELIIPKSIGKEDKRRKIKSETITVSAGDGGVLSNVKATGFQVAYSGDKSVATLTKGTGNTVTVGGNVRYSAAGNKSLVLAATVVLGDDSTVTGSATIELTVVRITFDKEKYKCGFTLLGKDKVAKTTGVVTVEPESERDSVTLSVTPAREAAVEELDTSQPGKIGFTLTGKVGANKPATLKATLAGLSCTPSAEVKVIIPKRLTIRPVGLPPDAPVFFTATKVLLNKGTTPAFTNVPLNKVTRVTNFTTIQTVQVLDQFGDKLDAIYASSLVEERFGKDWKSINQPLKADGTYSDPVGGYTQEKVSEKLDPTHPLALAWKGPGTPPTQDQRFVQKIEVKIAGHSVGAANRIVWVYRTGVITITPTP